ncbi:MAG: hypothetical protein HZB43_08595, partial [candidate division Zixibacteria bacterium]|nr:hypothetical protein [candidate division Zixibacteria bacterium]
MKMKRMLVTGAAVAVLLVSAAGSANADPMTPLFLGTAGAGTILGTGLDAAFGNPAQLGCTQSDGFHLRLVGIGVGIGNNSVGFAEYRKYNGADLNDQDKATILSKVPSDGLRLRTDGGASAMAVLIDGWSVHADAFAVGRGQFDRQIFELLFYGNADQSYWDFANTSGEGMAGGRIVLSHGARLMQAFGHGLYAGFSASYIRGLYYAKSGETHATLATQEGGLSGAGIANWTTAEGGNGFGLDLGLAMPIGSRWTAGLKLEHIVNLVKWSRNVRDRQYQAHFDDLTVDNYDDSLVVTTETSRPGAAFTRGLPPAMRAGIGRIGTSFSVAAEIAVALREGLGVSTRPSLATGLEFSPIHLLPLRLGASVGGESGWSFGCGAGVLLGPVRLDTGMKIDQGVW